MRKLMLTVAVLLIALLSAGYAQEQSDVEVLKLGIVHTNDTHGHLLPFRAHSENGWGGVARRRVEIQRARADTDYYWLVLDAGDVFQGTPISNMLTGFLDLECMNQMGYDAMCLGNHEFDFGYELIRSRLLDVNFDMLSCNVIDKERGTPVAQPYVILRRGDYRIGVIGATTETLLGETHPRIKDYVYVYPPTPIVQSLARYLRAIGCDVVIALTHQGYNRDMAMAAAVPELDLVVGGHTHTFLDEPSRVGSVVVTQNGQWGENLGVLKLEFERANPGERFRLAELTNEYVPLSPDKPEDDGLKVFIADYERRFEAEMGRVVCTAAHDFSVETVRLEQNPLASLICDAMRSATDSDVCLFNAGNFRAGLYEGEVTFGDLYGVLPYDNFMMKITLTGAHLREVLAYAGKQYGDGGFPQVSGMAVAYADMELAGVFVGDNLPVEFTLEWEGGQPVAQPSIATAQGWDWLDDELEYTMLTNDFLAIGGDGFPLNEDPYGPGYLGLEQRATFALWAAQQRVLEAGVPQGVVRFYWVNMENPGLQD
jgi:2',3'-cyclic-nucleotide 2'-phosphodiesterase (5'-nucleotidase family)